MRFFAVAMPVLDFIGSVVAIVFLVTFTTAIVVAVKDFRNTTKKHLSVA